MLTLGDSRPWVALDPSIPREDVVGAKACAKLVSEEARALGAVPKSTKETVREWFGRFHDYKETRGLSSVDDMRGYARNWILPSIETKDMRLVTREDVEGIVRQLDRAIIAWNDADGERGEGRLSASAAANVWGHLVHAFDEAVSSKEKSLRVLDVSPAEKVKGPETGPDREGPILYSDEIEALLRGTAVDPGERDVPMYRRRVWAMAIYTMTRRSELAAITKADVDVAHATISITKQVDRQKKKADRTATKKTKTRRSRTIDVEPAIFDLVQHLAKHPEGRGERLLRVPPAEDYAELLRRDLWTVGVRDDRLHTEDATRTKMTGHCLRDTGLTHMAVRGDSPIVIQWRGGHTDYKQTQDYVNRGRVEARRIGDPLPPVPTDLLPEPSRMPAISGGEELSDDPQSLLNSDSHQSVIISEFATPTGIELAYGTSKN
jgi:integrase